jgi:hypothetical protein
VSWSYSNRVTSLPLASICVGQEGLVAVGGVSGGGTSVLLTSPDGQVWNKQPTPADHKLESVATSGTTYVAVGGDIETAWQKSVGVVVVSGDGTNWNRAAFDPGARLTRVATGNGIFGAVGYNGIAYAGSKSVIISSPDGTNWNTRATSNEEIYSDIAYGAGVFVVSSAIKGNTFLYSSSNLTNWNPQFETDRYSTYGLSFANGMFRLAGDNDVQTPDADVFTSTDGVHWKVSLHQGPQPQLVIGAGNQFVGLMDQENLVSSVDGMHWEPHGAFSQRPVYGLGYGDGTLFAAGELGTIFQSDPLNAPALSVPVLKGNTMEFFVSSGAGEIITLESSLDLKKWSIWTTATNTTGELLFSIPIPAEPRQQFYRARQP